MSFHSRGWGHRFEKLGDEAEGVFEQVMTKRKRGFVRWGIERPPLKVADLPLRVRHSPDFLTTRTFVEVQGFGREQRIKLKVEKLDCLAWWSEVHPVEFFFWDTTNRRYAFVPLKDVRAQRDAIDGCTLEWFHEGKAFFSFPPEAFEGWVSFEPEAIEEAA